MELNYTQLLKRMLETGNLKSSSELAKKLGVTPQALSNCKRRGEMPAEWIFKFAAIYNTSIDRLLTGKDDVKEKKSENICAIAMIETEEIKNENIPGLAILGPEEIIYVGKLLRVLRNPDKFSAPAVKTSIDAFYRVAADEAL